MAADLRTCGKMWLWMLVKSKRTMFFTGHKVQYDIQLEPERALAVYRQEKVPHRLQYRQFPMPAGYADSARSETRDTVILANYRA